MNVRDAEFDRLLAEWLEDDAFAAPAAPVAAAVNFARAHPRRRDWLAILRGDAMATHTTTGLRAAAIAIAVVALLIVAITGAVLVGQTPDATPTPVPSSTPLAVEPLPTGDAPLEVGHRYSGGLVAAGSGVVGAEVEAPVNVAFTVLDRLTRIHYRDWESEPGQTCCWGLDLRSGYIDYHPVSDVYADACSTVGVVPTGPTVDGLVAALDEQANTELSALADVIVGGYPGKRFVMGPGSDLPERCAGEIFESDGTQAGRWITFWPNLEIELGMENPGPRDLRTVYVIDVEGHRVVFTTKLAPAKDVVALLSSMEFSIR